jgi:hypothetical protein
MMSTGFARNMQISEIKKYIEKCVKLVINKNYSEHFLYFEMGK